MNKNLSYFLNLVPWSETDKYLNFPFLIDEYRR
jgi:hypothetical protein